MKINKGISWTENENGFLLINPSNKKCLILDNKGKELWFLITQKNLISEVYEIMLSKYNCNDKNIIKNDIDEFFKLLIDNNFITKKEME